MKPSEIRNLVLETLLEYERVKDGKKPKKRKKAKAKKAKAKKAAAKGKGKPAATVAKETRPARVQARKARGPKRKGKSGQ